VQTTDTILQFLSLKQEHGETLVDYAKRFKQSVDNFKAIFGKSILDEYIEKTDDYKNGKPEEKKDQVKGSFSSWTTYVYLKNCDGNKYGSLKRSLQSQYALGNNQYPKTVSKMTDALTNHQWDDKYKAAENKKKENNNTGGKNSNDTSQDGKLLAQTVTPPVEKDTSNITCFCCGEKGHYSSICEKREEIPKDKWFVIKEKDKSSDKKVGWSGTQVKKGISGCQVHKKSSLHTITLTFFLNT
jgi:hypothetical protein